ncbi:MAG: DMT family transporter [Rhodobacteraceae bacterium]|nr:DMT family transporter [Paracoccaceae bacterium]
MTPAVSPIATQDAARIRAQAIGFMLIAILCFSLMDATVKVLAPRVGVVPTLWARYGGQMMIVLILIAPRMRTVGRTEMPGLQMARSLLMLCATICFFSGLSRIPLTEASALMAMNPVFITLGAALFLGESLGPRRIAGIVAALCGAMIVIRPGSEVFTAAALFPIGAAICYSGYALLTRRVGNRESVWTSLFYTGLVGTVLLTLAVPFAWQGADGTALALMAAVAVLGTAGQLSLIRAFSTGEAGMLAPYSYAGVVFAAVWSLSFFGEWPDIWTVLGALVIVASGLYVWYRETFRN